MNGLDISRCSELIQLECDNNINDLYQIFYFISLNKIRIGIESTNRLLEKNTQHELDNENNYGTVLWSIFGLILFITIAKIIKHQNKE